MKALSIIQQELNAPKDQYNNFGKYHYRSCEGILSALKPLLAENGCALVINDEVVDVGGRIYVKATATISNEQNHISATAYAREPEHKKGMDEAQITGATSSYARKYALNGLFAIDDTKDSDATNTHGKEQKTPPNHTLYDKLHEQVDKCKTVQEVDTFCAENKQEIYKMGKELTDKFRGYVKDIRKILKVEQEGEK